MESAPRRAMSKGIFRFLFLSVLLGGCPSSHGTGDDAALDSGTDTMRCPSDPVFTCWDSCEGRTPVPPVCGSDPLVCPAGSVDISTCPRRCPGEMPGCICDDGAWVCESGMCPAGINPFERDVPENRCSIEGAECNNGGGQCGAAIFCTCEDEYWNCAVAEPDPVCWCGREPSEGDSCNEEGMSCGACCPTAGEPDWPSMHCSDGRWRPSACPDVVCPTLREECPVDPRSVVGEACFRAGQRCGNACCGTATSCTEGRWETVPDAPCFCTPEPSCGSGTCNPSQVCDARCGPDDGLEYRCVSLPGACSECGCLSIPPGASCEVRDGIPHVTEGACG